MNRILVWYFGGAEQPSYYMEKDYTIGQTIIYAANPPVDTGLLIDIKDDGVSIFTGDATAILPGGENLNSEAEDYPEDTVIEEGSIVTCEIVDANGAGLITVQLELSSEEEVE